MYLKNSLFEIINVEKKISVMIQLLKMKPFQLYFWIYNSSKLSDYLMKIEAKYLTNYFILINVTILKFNFVWVERK